MANCATLVTKEPLIKYKTMSDIDLTPLLTEKMKSYARIRGRYNASELWFLLSGRTTPEEWMKPREREIADYMNMWSGIMGHKQVQDLLQQRNCEIKRVYEYKDIKLVGKADYLPDTASEVWEFKTSKELLARAKPWHEHQAQLYCTMFERKAGVVYQPVESELGLHLKEVGRVFRDDGWFNEQMEKLYEFHLKVEQLWGKY